MMFAFGARTDRPSLDARPIRMNKKPIQIENDVPLSGLSTFKAGGSASHFFRIKNKEEIKSAVNFAKEQDLPIFVLGEGSNVLFSDDAFSGLVIKLENKGIRVSKEAKKQKSEEGKTEDKRKEKKILITAESGETWDKFVVWTLGKGFYGLENLSGIPGTVGGAPIQNIGAYGKEVKDFIESVEIFDTEALRSKILSNIDCKFSYRDSIFKRRENKNLIVTAVTFKLSSLPSVMIVYKDLKEYFKGKNSLPTPQEVRDAVLSVRAKKFPNLKTHGTAGSFFKNIICDEADAGTFLKSYPDLPAYPYGNDKVKISTAYILDKICALKDFRIGDVGLFASQPLVVVNYGNATSKEIKDFISKVKKIVKEKTGLELQEEVVLV
ncbi:MAG TPA: UDP-N-acetylmuramate dehydrogenase [Candidatus Paceibacterota bacterium]